MAVLVTTEATANRSIVWVVGVLFGERGKRRVDCWLGEGGDEGEWLVEWCGVQVCCEAVSEFLGSAAEMTISRTG